MSLRGFHLVFITLATVISVAFCAWAFVWANDSQQGLFLSVCGALSGVLGVGLGTYGFWFAKKNLNGSPQK